MSFEHFERGYLLPKGCKDLIDVIRLAPQSKVFLKLPLLHSKPQSGIFGKAASQAPSWKGDIFVSDSITVKELAALVGQEPVRIIADAMELGIFANVNQSLGFKTISQIAEKYGFTAKRMA